MINRTTLPLIMLLLLSYLSYGQDYYRKDSTNTQKVKPILMQIKLKDGTIVKGVIKSQDLEGMKIETKNLGLVELKLSEVASMTSINNNMDENSLNYDYNAPNQYFYSQSGFMLKKGENQLQNMYGLINTLEFGISNHVSLNIGSIFPFGFGVLPVLLGMKISSPVSDHVRLFVGSRNLWLIGNSNGFAGVLSTGATIGTPDKNLTIGLGWGYASLGGISNSPSITLAGTLKIGERAALVTDNWFISSKNSDYSVRLISGGIKTIGRKTSIGFGVLLMGSTSSYTYYTGTTPITNSSTNYNATAYVGANFKIK